MGFDMYLRWDGITKQEEEAQFTGFSVVHGHVGYLREAFHGKPYATKVLCPEAFAADGEPVKIPNKTLVARLPAVKAAAIERQRIVYPEEPALTEHSPEVLTFVDFVALHAAKESEGKHPSIEVA